MVSKGKVFFKGQPHPLPQSSPGCRGWSEGSQGARPHPGFADRPMRGGCPVAQAPRPAPLSAGLPSSLRGLREGAWGGPALPGSAVQRVLPGPCPRRPASRAHAPQGTGAAHGRFHSTNAVDAVSSLGPEVWRGDRPARPREQASPVPPRPRGGAALLLAAFQGRAPLENALPRRARPDGGRGLAWRRFCFTPGAEERRLPAQCQEPPGHPGLTRPVTGRPGGAVAGRLPFVGSVSLGQSLLWTVRCSESPTARPRRFRSDLPCPRAPHARGEAL